MKRKGYLIALALVLAVNAVVLAGVAYNRSGTPKERMVLTARELHLSSSYVSQSENTGLSLSFVWHADPDNYKQLLTREKLEAIGYRLPSSSQHDEYGRKDLLDRKAYVVLEYNGAAWEAYLQKYRDKHAAKLAEARTEKQRKGQLQFQENFEKNASRLVLVDIGPDAAALRTRYPDSSKYLITRALIYAHLYKDKEAGNKVDEIRAHATRLLPNAVNVPRQYHAVIEKAAQKSREFNQKYDPNYPEIPDYKITLVYGQRNEPWIEAVAGK